MFKGEVLTPNGWVSPRVGEVIACMGGNGNIIWKQVENVERGYADFIHVSSHCLSYSVSVDHKVPVHRGFYSSPLSWLSGEEIHSMWRRSFGKQVKAHHITNAYPDSLPCSKHSAIREFALRHIDHNGTRSVSECVLSIFRRYLEYRLVYPQAYLITSSGGSPYVMCQSDATELVSLLFPFMRNYDYSKKAKTNAPARTYKTPASQLLQVACFFSGITSTVKGDIVKLYLRGRRGKFPVKPTITPSTKVELYHDSGWNIDVNHPMVRLDGKIIVL